jgi:hypothetical protein
MNSVNPSTLRDVCIILLSLVGVVCLIINTINSNRRKPSADVDLARIEMSINTVLSNQSDFKESLKTKQETKVCAVLVDRIDGAMNSLRETLNGSKNRHAEHESKISRQIGDVHARMDTQSMSLASMRGALETFMDEIRNRRSTHDAQNNHS